MVQIKAYNYEDFLLKYNFSIGLGQELRKLCKVKLVELIPNTSESKAMSELILQVSSDIENMRHEYVYYVEYWSCYSNSINTREFIREDCFEKNIRTENSRTHKIGGRVINNELVSTLGDMLENPNAFIVLTDKSHLEQDFFMSFKFIGENIYEEMLKSDFMNFNSIFHFDGWDGYRFKACFINFHDINAMKYWQINTTD